jgi:NMD protein affecting ribosome stability and mRNA decay
MKRCPRCDRGCQNKYELVCGECAHAEYLAKQELEALRVDPFAFAAEVADQTEDGRSLRR